MKKISYIILAIILVMAMLISPVSMLTASAADEQITPEWVLMGDVDLNGEVKINDAVKVLRVAASIDPAYAKSSKAFKAADIDKDGKITILDARKILLHAVGIKYIEDEFVKLLNDTANSVKETAVEPSTRMPFERVNVSKITNATCKGTTTPFWDVPEWGNAIMVEGMVALVKGEIESLKNEPPEESKYTVRNTSMKETYYWNFPVEKQDWSMKLRPEMLSSLEYTENTENKQILIKAKLKTEKLTAFPEDSTTTNHGCVFAIADATVSGGLEDLAFEGMEVSMSMTYSDCYVQYTIDSETGKPLYVEYFLKMTTTVNMYVSAKNYITMTIVAENKTNFDFVNVVSIPIPM